MVKAVAAPHAEQAEDGSEPGLPSLKQTDAKEQQSSVGLEPQPRSHLGKARKRRPASYATGPGAGPLDGAWAFYQQDYRIRDSFAQLVPRQPRQGGTRREAAWARREQARRPQFGWFDSRW
jgi:hypothetical protein